MKKYLAAAAALVAALAQPAAAITFSKPTPIYLAAGAEDDGDGGLNIATVIFCSNISGHTATLRIIIREDGQLEGLGTATLAHGGELTAVTSEVASINETLDLATDSIFGATLEIQSTQSGVICTAALIDTVTLGPNGVALHLVRLNPHPGWVE